MRPNSKTPCKDCVRRRMGCHAECEAYREFDAANRRRREEARDAAMRDWAVRKSYRPKYRKGRKGGAGWSS